MHEGDMIKRLGVEPITGYLERRRKGPIYPVIVANGSVYLSGLPPFDPETGDIKPAPVRAPGRTRARSNEAVPGSSRFVARASCQMQCLLHTRSIALRQVQ